MRARAAGIAARLAGGGLLLAAATAGGGWVAAQGLTGGAAVGPGAEAVVRALKLGLPPGSEVRFDSVDADPFGGSARFSNLVVRLGPENGVPGRVRATELELAGTPDALAAGRVALVRGRDVSLRGGRQGGGGLHLASVEVADVAPGPLLALLAGDAPSPASGTAGRLAAEGVEFGTGGDRLRAGRVAWDGFADGRATGVELRDVAGTGEAGLRLAIARLGFQTLDWRGVDGAALAAAMSRGPGSDPGAKSADEGAGDPGAILSATGVLLALAGGEAGGLALEGLSFAPAGAGAGDGLRLDRLEIGELSRQRIGPVVAGRLEAADAEARVAASGLTYDAVLEGFPLEEARAALATLPRTDEGVRRMGEILAGAEGRSELALESFAVTRLAGGGGTLSLERLAVTSDAEDGRAGTAFSVGAFAADLADLVGASQEANLLRSAGLARVTGKAEASWLSDQATRRATLHGLGVQLDGLGTLGLKGEVGVPGGTSVLDPPEDLAGLSLAGARLVYEDRSLVPRLLAAAAGPDGPPADAVADAFAGVVENPDLTPWLDAEGRAALAGFIRRPGRLEVGLAPTTPVPVPRLLDLALHRPQAVAQVLRLKVRATPPRP